MIKLLDKAKLVVTSNVCFSLNDLLFIVTINISSLFPHLKLLSANFHAQESIDRGHIVFGPSVYLSAENLHWQYLLTGDS